MTDQNNVTDDNIKITLADGDASVNPELLRGYLTEAHAYQKELDKQKNLLKGVIESAALSTKLPKKLVRAYFKARYNTETEAQKETGKVFEQLDEALEA